MQLPSWLAGLTGANKFANNPANGFRATLGDMGQAAAHSMLQHYRGQGGKYGGSPIIEGLNGGPGSATPFPQPAPEVMPLAPGASSGPKIEGGLLPPVMPPAPVQVPSGPISPSGAWGQTAPNPVGSGVAGLPLQLMLRMGLGGMGFPGMMRR